MPNDFGDTITVLALESELCNESKRKGPPLVSLDSATNTPPSVSADGII